MKVLFTGASSFTGCWFVRALTEAGHEVTATLTGKSDASIKIRGGRILILSDKCEFVNGVSFGDSGFIELAKSGRFDVLCHHGAMVVDYKSEGFDVPRALANNTLNLNEVLEVLAKGNQAKVMLTGSYFELGEGGGYNNGAVSPYALSKTFTTLMFKHCCERKGVPMGHFVVPNPFGMMEDDRTRFTTYLFNRWVEGDAALVLSPEYVRDNIHVQLLAQSYVKAVEELVGAEGFMSFRPSGYVESQLDFANRIAREARSRTKFPCLVEYEDQSDFPEPRELHNTDSVQTPEGDKDMWTEYVDYYMGSGLVKNIIQPQASAATD